MKWNNYFFLQVVLWLYDVLTHHVQDVCILFHSSSVGHWPNKMICWLSFGLSLLLNNNSQFLTNGKRDEKEGGITCGWMDGLHEDWSLMYCTWIFKRPQIEVIIWLHISIMCTDEYLFDCKTGPKDISLSLYDEVRRRRRRSRWQ